MTDERPIVRMPAACPASAVEGVGAADLCEIQHGLLEAIDHLVIATDVTGTILYLNTAARRHLGYGWEELVGRATPEVIHDHDEIAAHAATLTRLLGETVAPGFGVFVALAARGRPETRDWTCVRKDGSRFPVRLTVSALRNSGGACVGYVGVARDITETRRVEQELRIAATAFESQAAILITDAEQRILRVNAAFTGLTGYSAEEVVGRPPSILKSGHQDAAFYRQMWYALRLRGHWQGEIWNRRKNGEVFPEWLTITAVTDDGGAVTHYVSTFSDISDLKSAESEIHHLAFYDPLTGMPNRRLLLNRLEQARAASNRSGRYGALLMVDLDHFKVLNDTLGHDRGDHLLGAVARRLRSAIREGDTAARPGGDEFVVMLEDLATDAAAAAVAAETVAEKIRTALADPYDLEGVQNYFNSASIGVSLFRGHDKSGDVLLKQADIALYKAKDAGRNTIRFFDAAMQTALEARAELEAGLRQGLQRGEFEVYLQPQVDPARRMVGAEALLRWNSRERGLVPPGEFIPLAEETGLIVPLGAWVIDRVCALLADWAHSSATRGLVVAVNVSARQFRQPAFVEEVAAALSRHGADPRRLKLELTESLLLDNVEVTVARMEALRALGVHFSLDNFGTGYASLAYLKRFPFEQLKVDQSFIRDLESDQDHAAIVHAIIDMGRTLRLQVVAEGVERSSQHQFLASHGCALFQGYLFGRPMSIGQFELWLASGPASNPPFPGTRERF
jgi:diguanylate cyclase (GGDEF)-like protein/PAS domain S-box-containing protein